MNQAYKEALAIIVRQMLIALGTTLGVSGYLTPYLGEATNAIVVAILVAGAAGWSQLSQLFKRQKLVQALQTAGTTEANVDHMVRSTMIPTPSVTTPITEVPSTVAPPGPAASGL